MFLLSSISLQSVEGGTPISTMIKKNVTLKDVARAAGVSTATVARVIHEKGNIAEETRRQVEAVLNQTGYRINVVAQGLRKQQTMSIGHILHSIMPNPFYAGVALGVEQEALKQGWGVLMINVQGDAQRERLGVETLIQRRVDAILFTAAVAESNVKLALDAGLQVVQLQQPTAVPTHQVTADNYVGSMAAVEHLIALGHRRIAYIGAGPTYKRQDATFLSRLGLVDQERFSGYLAALQKYQIPVDEQLIAFGRYYSLDHEKDPTMAMSLQNSSCSLRSGPRRSLPPAISWPPAHCRRSTSNRCASRKIFRWLASIIHSRPTLRPR